MNGEGQPVAPVGKIRKAECSKCGDMRNCEVRGHYEERYSDEHFQASTEWFILECRGCEYVFVQTVSTNSEDCNYYYEEDGSEAVMHAATVRYWPALSKRTKPEWMTEYGIEAVDEESLGKAMLELYGALDNDLRMLAAIGIRTAYDIASELLGADPALTFAEKLDHLVTSGRIGITDKDRLETMVDAGTASVHRGWRPKADQLNIIMDVLEHFIHEAFAAPARRKKLDEGAAKLKETVPPRQKKGKVSQPPASS